jgi:hypothetical protein
MLKNCSMPASAVIPVLVYGERRVGAEDVSDHRWTFSQSIADVAPEECGGEAISPPSG